MTYGIKVWGSAHDSKINKIFIAQNKIVRVLFGDREKYIDKFRTCVRRSGQTLPSTKAIF